MPLYIGFRPIQSPQSSQVIAETVAVPAQTEVSAGTFTGTGQLVYAFLRSSIDDGVLRFYCDGVQMRPRYTLGNFNAYGHTTATPFFSLTLWTAPNAECCLLVTAPYPFLSTLELRVWNNHAANPLTAFVYAVAAIQT